MTGARILACGLLLLALCACGEKTTPPVMWQVSAVDPAGRPVDLHALDDQPCFLRFDPPDDRVTPIQRSIAALDSHIEIEALPAGSRYEITVPGYLPAVLEADPQGEPLRLRPGYPVDVVWPEEAVIEQGFALSLAAQWRGPGDHPEALARSAIQCAGVIAGDPGVAPQPGLDEVVLDVTKSRTIRIRVPWSGRYRLTWGKAQYTVERGPGRYHLSGYSTQSPGDGVAFEVTDLDVPVRLVLPAN